MLQHDVAAYKRRWEAFGWQALAVDGHDIPALLGAYEQATGTEDRPTVVLARTFKGRGLGQIENAEGWHGRALDRDTADRVTAGLLKQLRATNGHWEPHLPQPASARKEDEQRGPSGARPLYEVGGKEIATRKGFGDGLAALGQVDPRIVVLDGDVENSTYTEEFEKVASPRFLECYIAEQNMTGMAMGLAARGRVAFAATFACFLTRAYDFIRMAAISNLNVKLVGTHAGVSIGEDGPSQMGLEDLAMMCAEPNFTVLYPADATSAWRATWLVADHSGPCYLRIGRPTSPVLYGAEESFAIGKCKVLRQSANDLAMIVAAGVTVAEALRTHDVLAQRGIHVRVIDLFSVQPVDRDELVRSARDSGRIVITVEDHYLHGGIGDVVFQALATERIRGYKLAVAGIPRSGKPKELIEKFGIDYGKIVSTVQAALA
jgi:transketolase